MSEYFFGLNYSLLIQLGFYSVLTFALLFNKVKEHYLLLLILIYLKFGAVFLIFSSLDLSSWLKIDDIAYFNISKELLSQGYGLFSSETFERLIYLNGGIHIMYSWINMLLHSIFGIHYFASVFFNVFLTFICGALLYDISLKITGMTKYSLGLFIFFCLHWDILTWSSFLNLKDIFVLLLTLAFFWVIICRLSIKPVSSLLALLLISILFYWTRFYIPLFVGISYAIYLIKPKPSFFLRVLSLSIFLFAFVNYLGFDSLKYFLAKLRLGGDIFFGVSRFLLTPLPWKIEDSYIFLIFSSCLHFVFLLPAAIGSIQLTSKYREVYLLSIFFVICLLVYGSLPELQGPRHRIQISFMIIWFQYHSIFSFLRKSYA